MRFLDTCMARKPVRRHQCEKTDQCRFNPRICMGGYDVIPAVVLQGTVSESDRRSYKTLFVEHD